VTRINRKKAFEDIEFGCRSSLLLLATAISRSSAARTVHPVRQAAHAKDAVIALEAALLTLADARNAAELLCSLPEAHAIVEEQVQ
jgi:hypothetical protein